MFHFGALNGVFNCNSVDHTSIEKEWVSHVNVYPWKQHDSSQFSSIQSLSHVWLCGGPMDCSTPGFPVHHQLLELSQTHIHQVDDAIQSSRPLLSPSPPTFNLSQSQNLPPKSVSPLRKVEQASYPYLLKGRQNENHNHRKLIKLITWTTALSNSMKLWAMPCSVQFNSVAQSCPALCDSMNHSTPGLPVHHHLPEFTQTHVHRVGDAIQPSHPLSSPSPPAPNPSQHQGLFKWVNSSHEVAKVLEFQL